MKTRRRQSNATPAGSVAAAIVLSLVALLGAAPAAALQVSPTYQVFEVKPGDKAEGRMTVTNNEDEEVTLTPDVKEWFRLNANAAVKVDKWLRLDDKRSFTLKVGESRTLSYKLVPPKKAKGELAGAITLTTKPKANMITMQLSIVQYVGLKGTEKLGMDVQGVGINISSNTEVGVMVANTGNVHIRPRGYIYLDDEHGQRVMNVEIPTGQPTFPGATRVYSNTVKGFRLSPGKYTARVELRDVDRQSDFPVRTKKFSLTPEGKVEVR